MWGETQRKARSILREVSTWRRTLGHRLSKIYTRTGDDGTTGLGTGDRVAKDSLRVEAYGTVDETNSHVGVILSYEPPEKIRELFIDVQHDLFDVGGELATPGMNVLRDGAVQRLESALDEINEDLPALKDFILPGGGPLASHCHVARTVCRRAERTLVSLAREEPVRDELSQYLNRLSDLLFVAARALARASGHGEVLWDHQRRQ